jgi:hypothetical protein
MKALGLNIPETFLLGADEVIEYRKGSLWSKMIISRAHGPVGSIASYRTVAPEGHAIIYLDRHRRWLDNRGIDSRPLGRRHAVLLVCIAQRRRRFPGNVDRVQDVALSAAGQGGDNRCKIDRLSSAESKRLSEIIH